MNDFFEHLRPAPPADDREALKTLRTLEDLERRLGTQTAPRIVRSALGRRVVAPFTLSIRARETQHYDRNYPSTTLPVPGDVNSRINGSLARLESAFNVPLLPYRMADRTQPHIRGWHAGVSVTHPWEVVHRGGQRWRCAGGKVDGGGPILGNEQEIQGADLTIREGFIGFWAKLSPFANSEKTQFIYRIECGPLEAVTSYVNAGPTRTDVGEQDILYVWEPGVMFVPVAYVEAPTAERRARVIQERSDDLHFPPTYDAAGLPYIT